MSLKFHGVKRKVLAGPEEGQEKFFAQVRCGEPITYEKLCERIAGLSTVTPGDVDVVMDGLERALKELLDMGHTVNLGALGNVRICVGSKGAETEKGFNANLFKKPKIRLTPGKPLKYVCEEMSFEKIAPKKVVIINECDQPHVG